MTKWVDFKQKLSQRIPWLTAIDKPFYVLLDEAINANPIEPLWYDPLLIEGLFKDVGEILNRCLTYRRDAQDLEVTAVKAAADYAKFEDLVQNQRETEVNAQALGRLKAESEAAVGAAMAFQVDVTNGVPLSNGFEAIETGKQKGLQAAMDLATRQVELINERWQVIKRFEDEAQARHTEDGNSNNYGDRMQRVLRFLAEDLQEAFAKSRAMLSGVNYLYGKEYTLPDMKSDKSLDDLVHVVRAASRYLESEALKDSSYDMVIPLAQPWLMGAAHPVSLISADELKQDIENSAAIQVDLSPAFRGQTHIRLKGIGVSFGDKLSDGMDPGVLPEKSAYRLSAVVELPSMSVGGQSVPRPPIRFANVSVFSGSSGLAWYSGAACVNANPVGVVTIKLYPWAVHSLANDAVPINKLVQDVKLHLSIVSRPSA